MRAALLVALTPWTLLACGDGGGGGGDDVLVPDASGGDGDARPIDAGEPDAAPRVCGTDVAPLADIVGTEGLAIADDGTVYYSQSGHVGRWVPGGAGPVDDWVALSGTSTVWGMAITGDGLLYVATPAASPSAGIIWRIDTTAATPSATMFYPSAGRPNGLTLGPDGGLYYGDFAGGHVYRLDSSGNRTTVTDTTIQAPNGVLFDDDGTLLVARYQAGDVLRLTLDAAYSETARGTAGSGAGNPDGLARDDQGRYYVTDNGGGEVLRYDSQFQNPEAILPGVGAAANMAFGRGALACTDLYVTSSAALRRIEAGAEGVP
jgi:sugar lactone lactonase YvrE